MNRRLALLLAAAMVWGCRTPTPTFDPFQGPPRIPPPGTGQVGQVTPNGGGYYADQQPAASAAAPPRYVPRDGSYQFRSGAVDRGVRGQGSGIREENTSDSGVATADYEQDVTESGLEQGSVRQAANWEQEGSERPRYDARIRVVEPATKVREAAPADDLREPGRFEPEGPVTEISDLPQERTASQPRATIRAASDRATRSTPAGEQPPASPSRFASTTRSTASAQNTTRQRYGYDPQYRSLQGRLEFSESEDRWKLRYIPIDGQTDKHGGSVILSPSPELDGFEPGEFVTVEGEVGKRDPRSRGFAPDYQVQRITRLQ
jgi:hypothetical protein